MYINIGKKEIIENTNALFSFLFVCFAVKFIKPSKIVDVPNRRPQPWPLTNQPN